MISWEGSISIHLLTQDYNYFRDYDSVTGRYVESDPIGLIGGPNTYAYAGDDPIESIDPDGLVLYQPPDKPLPNKGWPVCDGHGGITIQYPTNPMIQKCMKDCVAVHEAVHIRELRALTPSVCSNRERWVRPKFDTPEQNNASEVRAYRAELQCLIKKLQGLSDCDECKKLIQYQINSDVPKQIRNFSAQ